MDKFMRNTSKGTSSSSSSPSSKKDIREESQECPLCGETFSLSKIEAHAAACGLEETTTARPSVKRPLSTSNDDSPLMEVVAKKIKGDGGPDIGKGGLSDKSGSGRTPLAEILRPKDFNAYFGQLSSVGEGTQLRKLLDSDCIPSIILWGPPGCGKTSLANVIANKVKGKSRFVKMSACTCGVSEVREVVKQAKNDQSLLKRNTILFMDEVHRFNKAQQDAFLPHIESGTITFIGATTENPSFSLNAALLSRCRVVVLEKLDGDVMTSIIERALAQNNVKIVDSERTDKSSSSMTKEAVNYLSNIVDGDARSAINTLQILLESRDNRHSSINLLHVKEAAKRSHVLYDRTGDQHFFMASALQKSIRGSDDNAALYWLGRMMKGGEDPTFIARRLVRIASEDVGLGDPTALSLAVAAFQGCQLIGKPECDVLLAQAVVHLARAPKSHEVYHALTAVYQTIDQGELPPVPLQLRNSTSRVTDQLGWGRGYSHNLNDVNNIQYMPDELKGVNFFKRS